MGNDEAIFLAKIQQAITLLNEIDDTITNNPDMQKNIDWEISDYLHLIENETLSEKSKLEIDDRLKQCRIVRRQINHIQAIGKVFGDNRGKLTFKNSREILYSMIKNTVSKLDTEYNYRVLDQETINNLCKQEEIVVEEKKKTRGKQPCISKEDLQAKLDSGMKSAEIAKELGVRPEYISRLKAQYNMTRKYNRRG